VSRTLTLLPGMFPTLATVTLWSSLGFAAVVAFQAGARVLTGSAYDSFTKLGYMLALMAISLAVATAYLFGPEPEGVTQVIALRIGFSLHRAWAPLTLIAGLSAGFASIYLAVAGESSDPGAAYKPVTLTPQAARESRAKHSTTPPSVGGREATGVAAGGRELTGGMRPAGPREPTGVLRPVRSQTTPPRDRAPTGGLRPARSSTEPPRLGEATGVLRAAHTPTDPARLREATGVVRARRSSDPSLSYTQPGIGPLSPATRPKSGPLPPIPEHLRHRLHYVALTAELTGGGIDARREDGLSRLVLWRDVVGVVVRRLPAVYDGAAFVDIVSTSGSTLRIVPWTRLTGELIEGEGDARPRAVVEHVIARCPGAKLDPATRQFLDSGEPAQLPDLDTLRAHDDRLA
jgi:hypothetical protein